MRFFIVVSAVVVALILVPGMTDLRVQASVQSNCVLPNTSSGIPSPSSTTSGELLINEVLTNPHTNWNCSASSSSSEENIWIEIYNPQIQPFDLYAARARFDSGPSSNAYCSAPYGTIIAARSFFVFFPFAAIGNCSLALSPSNTLRLITDSAVVDAITIPSLGPDQSYARTTDGDSKWQISNYPTIGTSNMVSTPKATPTSTATSTPPKQQKNGKDQPAGTNKHPNTTNGNDQQSPTDGIQPSWNRLQFPGKTTASTSSASSSSSLAPPQQDSTDIAKKILLTSLVFVLLIGILWYLWYQKHSRVPRDKRSSI